VWQTGCEIAKDNQLKSEHETDRGRQAPLGANCQRVETQGLSDRWVRFDHALLTECGSTEELWRCFDAQTQSLGAQPVTSGGRAAAWFVQAGSFDAVLRYFRRGGLVAKFIKNRYFWTGLSQTRAFREFDLLSKLWRAGLPVPRPLGAAVWKKGLTYRAALLTQRIPAVQPLAYALDIELWRRAGAVIASMHRFGVWHADLNAFNVLWDTQGKVWLIDFDRGRSGRVTPSQRAENVSRLLRSLKKVGAPGQQECWVALLDGYKKTWSAGDELK